MKKTLSLILAPVMLTGWMPAQVSAADASAVPHDCTDTVTGPTCLEQVFPTDTCGRHFPEPHADAAGAYSLVVSLPS